MIKNHKGYRIEVTSERVNMGKIAVDLKVTRPAAGVVLCDRLEGVYSAPGCVSLVMAQTIKAIDADKLEKYLDRGY